MEFNSFSLLVLQLAVMLLAAVGLGHAARRLGQPAVVGEILGGLLIGVTVLGTVAPGAHEWLFLASADAAVARDAVVKVGMLFFLFVAGSEVDLSDVRRMGPRALSIGLAGTLVPLAAGIGLVYALPVDMWNVADRDRFALAVFVGLSLANSANPVLARILMDLGMLKSEVGAVAMTATVVDDIVIWSTFSLLLGSSARDAGQSDGGALGWSLLAVVGLVVVVVGGGRLAGARMLQLVRRTTTWPTGYLGLVTVLVLSVAALAEAVGIHAFLGAFLVGVALSGHDRDHREAHDVAAGFSLGFFAPIYFVSMAMTTDFVANFDVVLVTIMVIVAFVTKIGGVLLGARAAGMPIDRTARAVAWGLNARGATGIVLAGVGLAEGIIDERIFVSLVVTALVTSIAAGPMMSRTMRRGAGPDVSDASSPPRGAVHPPA